MTEPDRTAYHYAVIARALKQIDAGRARADAGGSGRAGWG